MAKETAMSWFDHGTSHIYYEETGNGTPVLLLPGFTDSIERHEVLRRALELHYRVIAADLPGSGRSGPQPRQYTPSYFEDDARALAALLRHLKAEPAHLLGFSDGGEDALLMAALDPSIARSVVAWGAGGSFSDPGGHLRQTMYNLIDYPIPPLKGFRDQLVERYGETNARAMTQSEVTALGAIIDAGGDVSRSKVGNIACPVLLIAGANDMFVPKSLIDELAGNIRTVETLIVEGAGHDVHNARPAWFAQAVGDWLLRTASPAEGRVMSS
jgi:pimeloyl-ACP methyl ester carboxylesterase